MTPTRLAGSALFLAAHWAYAALVLTPWLVARRRGSEPPRRPLPGPPRSLGATRAATPGAPPGPQPGVAQFDRLARLYDAVSWPLTAPLFAAVRGVIEPLLPLDGRVLDLASGPGRELRSLARLVPRGQVVGVDLAPGMLARARRRLRRSGLDNWSLLQADAAALPDALEAQFDLVHCSLAHHHFTRPELVATEALRCLRPGGVYAIVDTVEPWLTRRLAPLSGRVDPGFQRFHSPAEFDALLRGAGFASVAVRPLAPGVAVVLGRAPAVGGPTVLQESPVITGL